MKSDNGFVINEPIEGIVKSTTKSGNPITLNSTSDYPKSGKYSMAIFLEESEEFELLIRIPDWCDEAIIKIGDEIMRVYSGYTSLARTWNDGDTVEIDFEMHLRSHLLNGRTAYTYGPLVLARDEMKEGKKTDSEFTPSAHNAFKELEPHEGEVM